MTIGVPKEIKNNEARVGLHPANAAALVCAGHRVIIESGAGQGSGYTDEDYIAIGAEMLPDAPAVYAKAEMIVKVKEPLAAEYSLIREGQILFTYFHFSSSRALTEAMLERKAICIAYETVEDKEGKLPLLIPHVGSCRAHVGPTRSEILGKTTTRKRHSFGRRCRG